jgi:spore coat polysaccharide biosynthesis protein SpsF (cytidylyltransferase family)
MTTGIIINARMGSKRLPNKHLLELNNKPILSFLLQRVENEFFKEISSGVLKIIIGTGNRKNNKKFLMFQKEFKCSVFFGHDTNIPSRHLEIAKFYSLDNIINLDGDDILCAPEAIRKVYNLLLEKKPLIQTNGLPFGMNAFGYSREILEKYSSGYKQEILETGWTIIFKDDHFEYINFKNIPKTEIRATLDYMEDFEFFKIVLSNVNCFQSTSEIIKLIISKQYQKINIHLNEKYWENFRNEKYKS